MNYLEYFLTNYPDLVESMEKCSHHYDRYNLNPYHLEGSVFIHTLLVHNEAEYLKDIQITTLLHDIGKMYAREEDHLTKRVKFYGHEGISFFLSIEILAQMINESIINKKEAESILHVISIHGKFYDLLDEDKIIDKNRLNLFNNDYSICSLLMEQLVCDNNGRFSNNKKRIEFRDFFAKQLNEENHNKLLKKKEEEYKDKQITFLVGLPCSGKSFSIDYEKSQMILSRDNSITEMYPDKSYNEAFKLHNSDEVDKLFNAKFEEAIRQDMSFIIDKTNLSRKSRMSFINRIPKDYHKKAYIFATKFSTIVERNNERKEEGKFINNNVYMQMMKSFSIPTFEEFDSIEWIWN